MRLTMILILAVCISPLFTACGKKTEAESPKIKAGAMGQIYDSVAKAAKPGTISKDLPSQRR